MYHIVTVSRLSSKLTYKSLSEFRTSLIRHRTNAASGTLYKTVTSEVKSGIVKKEKEKKEVIINTKYDKCSNPMYEHLLYSSELDVFQTVKRGKIWLEKEYAKKMAMDRELKVRQQAATSPSVPIALEYLYGGSNVVQREDYSNKEETIEAEIVPFTEETEFSHLDSYVNEIDENIEQQKGKQYPYSVYQNLNDTMIPPKLSQIESGSEFLTLDNTESVPRGRGRGRRRGFRNSRKESSDSEPLQSIPEADVIGNDFLNPNIRKVFSEDYLIKYGTPNPEIEPTNIPCGGCGATLNCTDDKMPGYIPSQVLESKKNIEELRATLCQRCYFIKEYDIALKVTVAPEDYPKTIQHIQDKEALIILVVDLTDFPGSVWPNILDLLGYNKKIILVGNKLDLILPDQKNYVKNITQIIQQEFLEKCRQSEEGGKIFPYLVSAMCVSARTGHNIEVLVDKIFRYWRWNNQSLPGDIYIVGCTNVGKSSIFNSLIDSDLCKIRAVDLVSRAMTSPVPGTTLNLLKFPVTRPEPNFINDRAKRMKQFASAFKEKEKERLKNLQELKKVDYAIPAHFSVTHTLKNALKERVPKSGYLPTTEVEVKKDEDLPGILDPSSQFFRDGKWCFDSPGTVCQDQIINILTAEEISKTLPVSPLIPRTYLLRIGQSLCLGGIARLDFICGELADGSPKEENKPVLVTVFCSTKLPVNILETQGVENFLGNPAVSKLTQVPSGSLERRRDFPRLLGKQISTTGFFFDMGCRDIVMSSAGWAMITTPKGEKSTFIAYTPDGKGIADRKPFLPFSVQQKGKRIQGSPTYRNDKLYLKYIDLY